MHSSETNETNRLLFPRLLPLLASAILLTPGIASADATGTYLEDMDPVVYLQLDATAGASTTLADGSVLDKSTSFPGDFPNSVAGPNSWAGGAWDFSTCDGGYTLTVDSAEMNSVGNIFSTDGMSVSFWTKGTYTGTTMRIMAGPFDVGTNSTGFWGGTSNYLTATSPNGHITWDNLWHHLAVTVDYRSFTDNIQIYQDGTLVATRSAIVSASTNTNMGGKWTFGARNYSISGFDYGPLAGIAVFDRNLSPYEVNHIMEGPVTAGLDQTVYITTGATLNGVVPSGDTPAWTKASGPSGETINSPGNESTTVDFTQTGEYDFQLSAGGLTSTVHVTVLPNAPPTVTPGNGITASTSDMPVTLQGVVTDVSNPPGGSLTQTWQVVSSPPGSVVTFGDPNDPQTTATFSLPGLYRLELLANDGQYAASAELSVLITDSAPSSYVRLLRPVVLLGMDRPAKDIPAAESDMLGNTGYQVRHAENGLPQLDTGARSYTGYAWDFGDTDSDIEMINGSHLLNIHNKAHPARSFSYWFKARDSGDEGYTSSLLGLQSYRSNHLRSGTYSHEVTELQDNLPAGPWHHVAVVVESNGTSFVRKLYIDGSLEDSATNAYINPYWEMGEDDMQTPWHVASRGRTGEDDAFGGLMDDFAVFDYALSASDVSYLYNGPSPAELALIAIQDTLTVDAGPHQYVPIPSSYIQTLSGTASSAAGLTPHWRLAEGDGTVSFNDPSSLTPQATFTPNERNADGLYSSFLLELSLRTATGRTLVADTMRVVFHPVRGPAIRALSPTPPPNQHPRILFTQADLPELRSKATTVPVSMAAMTAMTNRAADLDNPSDAYGYFYQQLKMGNSVPLNTVYEGNAGGIFKVMAESAYVAWIGSGGVSDNAKLDELADVFAAACRDLSTWYEPVYTNRLLHDINWAVGLNYDLLYNSLTPAERTDARSLLSLMTKYRHPHGSTLSIKYNNTNWAGYHDHNILSLMAIEGEEGYDDGVLDAMERKNADFLTRHGVHESGLPHEGYAYYTFGMTWHSVADYTIARRSNRENLFDTTRFYRSIETAFRLLDPDGSALRSHGDVVEDSTGSGALATPPRHLKIAKYLWPNDRMVDYVYGKLLTNHLVGQERFFTIFDAVFGEDVAYPAQTLAQAAGTLAPNSFCPDAGYISARNQWQEDGLNFQFRSRQDKYYLGHVHSDVNTFELWSHGKQWIIDPGKFAGTQSDMTSTIFIDGVGACSSQNFRWPSVAGRIVDFAESPNETIASGDAQHYYAYSLGAPRSGEGNPADFKTTTHGLMWSDFYTPRPGFDIPDWMTITPYDLNNYDTTGGLYDMVPVEFAYRTALLTKTAEPFALIVDDIQKDFALHDYTWIANFPINGIVEVESQTSDQMILRYVGEAASGPRLLVKVLEANGHTGGLTLDTTPVNVGVEAYSATRIKIESTNVLKPDFKVLLYPHLKGDTLPTVAWSGGDTVTITTPSAARQFQFTTNVNNRTIITPVFPELNLALLDGTTSEFSTPLDPGSIRVTSDAILASNLSVNLTLAGSADATDFTGTLSAGAHTFPSGLDQFDLNLQALNDALAEGPESLDVTLAPGVGYSVGTNAALSISINDTPFDLWRFTNNFPTALDTNDSDFDSVPLLIEYATGANPTVHDQLYTLAVDPTSGIATFTLPSPIPADVTLTAEWTTNLTQWFDTNVTLLGQTIQITDLSAPQAFVRLKANRTAP